MSTGMSTRTRNKFEEVEWLSGGGVHPLNIATALNTNPDALYALALKYQLPRIQSKFLPFTKGYKS